MYVIKKCENHSYGKNKWEVIHTTPDKEDAIAFAREEYRLLLSSDPNLSSEDIDRYMNNYYNPPKSGQYIGGRREFGHGNIWFSFMRSTSQQHRPAERPSAREALDLILGA